MQEYKDINITIFPLYDSLIHIVEKKYPNKLDLTNDELIEIIEGIKKINKVEDMENLFVLIRIYGLRSHSEQVVFELPFEGQKRNVKNVEEGNEVYDIKFDIRNFPINLKLILLEYIRIIDNDLDI